MRVGEETQSVSGFQDRPLIRPSVHSGAPSPHSGEGLGSVQMGMNLVLCGTFGYIYWELGRSAPVGRRAATWGRPYGVFGSRPSFFVGAGHWPTRVPGDHKGCPYKRGGKNLPPHPPPSGAPSPQGGRHDGRVGTPAPTAEFGQKRRAHNVRPYNTIINGSAHKKRDRF